MTNLAFVGAGRMANAHADALKNIPGSNVYGVFDPVKETANKFSQTFSCSKIYSSLDELAADQAVQGVLVCNYSDQHYAAIVKLLDAGKKFIFCEKALVRNLADGEDLLKKAQTAKAQIMVGHHRRYLRSYARLKEIIANGELGTIRMAKVNYCHSAYTRQWGDFFADFERSGGVILDMMTHFYDQLNWYFGEPESISARGLMFDKKQPKPADYVSGTLTYKNGVFCNIDCSWQRYGTPSDRIEIYGDKACAVITNVLNIYTDESHTELIGTEPNVHIEQMKGFIAMIEKGIEPRVTLRDGFNSAAVALKTIEAAQQKKTLYF